MPIVEGNRGCVMMGMSPPAHNNIMLGTAPPLLMHLVNGTGNSPSPGQPNPE